MSSYTESLQSSLAPDRSLSIPMTMGENISGSMALGSDESFTQNALAGALRVYAGYSDKESGLGYVSQDYFEEKGFAALGMEFREEETPSQLQLRLEYWAKREINQRKTVGMGTLGQLGWGMVGGMSQPGDIALAMLPMGAMATGSRAAATAMMRGRKMSQVVRQLQKAERLKIPDTRFGAMKLAAKTGFLEATAESASVYALSQYTDRDFGKLDAVGDIALGGLFSTGMGSLFAGKVARQGQYMRQMAKVEGQFHSFMNNGDPRAAFKILQEFDEEFAGGAFRRELAKDPEAQAAYERMASDNVKGMADTLEADNKTLQTWFARNSETAFTQRLRFLIESRAESDAPLAQTQMDAAIKADEVTEKIRKGEELETEEQLLFDEILGESAEVQWTEENMFPGTTPQERGLMETEAFVRGKYKISRPLRTPSGEPAKVINESLKGRLGSMRTLEDGTRVIVLDEAAIKADFEAGMPYLLGKGESESSLQKQVIFEDIDMQSFVESFETWEQYRDFIAAHEEAHVSETKAQYAEGKIGLMDPESLSAEHFANIYAARKTGVVYRQKESNAQHQAQQKLHEASSQNQANEHATQNAREEEAAQKVTDSGKEVITSKELIQGYDAIRSGIQPTQPIPISETKVRPPTADEIEADIKAQIREKLEAAKLPVEMVEPIYRYHKSKQKWEPFAEHGSGHNYNVFLRRGPELTAEQLDDFHYAKANGLPIQTFFDRQIQKIEDQLLNDTHNVQAQTQHDHRIQLPKRVKDAAAANLNYLKTWLSGGNRKHGQTGDTSVEAKQEAQAGQDQAAIHKVLVKYDLRDVMYGVPFSAVRTPKNKVLAEKYADNLKEASNLFWKEMYFYLANGREVEPSKWKNLTPEEKEGFLALAEAINDTHLSQLNQMNAMGAGIRLKEGHGGLSYRWDDQTMISMGEPAWRKSLEEKLDWEATAKNHGNVLIDVDADGKVTTVPFTKNEFLKRWWREINQDPAKKEFGRNIAGSFAQHRKIEIKSGNEVDLMVEMSGHTNMGQMLSDQVRYRSEMIAMSRELGNDALGNLDIIMGRLGVPQGVKMEPSKWKGMTVRNARTLNLKATAQLMLNQLDNPVNKEVAGAFRKARQVSNTLFLTGSGISALSDVPTGMMVLQQMGLTAHTMDLTFVRAFLKANRRNFGSEKKMREFFEGMGAGGDAVANAVSRRFGIGGDQAGDIFQQLNNTMFNLNYLTGITQAGQEAFMDVVTQSIARQLAAGKLDDAFIRDLAAFGIDPSGWSSKNLLKTPDEQVRFDLDTLPADQAQKVREYLIQRMNDAVVKPDAAAQAYIRFGTRDGTLLAGAIRMINQYMSFPIAMTRLLSDHFLRGTDGKLFNASQTSAINAMAYLGSMFMMAWFVTMVKDLSRYKEPITVGNASPKDMARILNQSGLLGIIEPFLGLSRADASGFLAPLPSHLMQMTGQLGRGDLAGMYDTAVSPVKSAPLVGRPAHFILSQATRPLDLILED